MAFPLTGSFLRVFSHSGDMSLVLSKDSEEILKITLLVEWQADLSVPLQESKTVSQIHSLCFILVPERPFSRADFIPMQKIFIPQFCSAAYKKE